MFSIFKREKPVVLRFITKNDGLVDLFPPKPLSQCVPTWWKNTPSYLESPSVDPRTKKPIVPRPSKLQKTVKHCYSIQKTLERGIALPLWQDMYITVDHNGKAHPVGPAQAPNTLGEQHPKAQYPGLLSDDWVNFKFKGGWLAYTEEYVPFYMTNPFYHMQDHQWQAMPGVIEFHHQHNLNVNTILRKPEGTNEAPKAIEYEFKAGDTLAYLVPMTDRKIIIKAEQVSEKEYEKLKFGHKMWFSSAAEHRKRNMGGCPFNFG